MARKKQFCLTGIRQRSRLEEVVCMDKLPPRPAATPPKIGGEFLTHNSCRVMLPSLGKEGQGWFAWKRGCKAHFINR